MSNTLKLGNGQWATGKDTVLAYNDLNSNYKPLAFSFSRNSSATVVNKDGLIETVGSGEPRIDFQGNTKGALLLEPQRTNNLPKSERLDQWSTASNATVEYGFPDPFGGNKAVKATSSSAAQAYQIYRGFTSANTYSLSVYAKKGTAKVFRIDFGTRDNGYFSVNLETGESDGTSGFSGMINTKIEPLDNDWYRISLTSTTVNPNYVRMGANHQEGFLYMAFAQLEQGSYPTSYIPTYLQSGGVTRVRDLSDTQNLSHVIGQTEGVIFYDAILVHKSTDTSEDLFELSIDDGSNQNIFFLNNYNNTLVVAMVNGGSYQFTNNSYNPTEGERYKLAFAYKQNDFALYINGNQIATDLSGTVPTMNQITFGNYYNNQFNLSNSVKVNNLKFYDTRLSNSELAALTQ